MNDPILEAELRKELRLLGERWSKMYKIMSDESRREYLVKITARRKAFEANEAALRQKQEDEAIPRGDGQSCGTLQHGTGGGKRVILKGSPFS